MYLEFKYYLNKKYISLLIWNTVFYSFWWRRNFAITIAPNKISQVDGKHLYSTLNQKSLQVQLLCLGVLSFTRNIQNQRTDSTPTIEGYKTKKWKLSLHKSHGINSIGILMCLLKFSILFIAYNWLKQETTFYIIKIYSVHL